MRTLKAFFVSFLVSLLSFNAIGEEYYVSVGGSGKQDGSSWENSMNGQEFAKKLSVAKSGTVFYLMEGKYYPEDGTKGFIITNAVSLFGGYTEEMTKDETITFDDGSWSEEHMSILVGDISINEGGNTPVTIKLGEDEKFLSERVSTQSSSVEGAFIASVASEGGSEIVLRRGVFYKSKPSPMEEKIDEDTMIVTVGDEITLENTPAIYFGTIGDTIVAEEPVITNGVMTTKVHHVQVLPKFYLDGQSRRQYYVKEKATGTGDGSSWKNAMSGASFAYAFDKVVNNVTFHFAAGTYEPTQSYTYEGESYICFGTSKSVNLIGGYGANPSQGDGTNVVKNKTIFKGSVKTILYNPGYGGNILISGIEVTTDSGNSSLAFVGGAEKSTLTLDSCSFYGSYTGVALAGVDTAYISNCNFLDHTGFGASAISSDDLVRLVVSSSLFSGNHLTFNVSGIKDAYINNSTFYDNTFNIKGDSATLVNNTFCSNCTYVKTSVVRLVGNYCAEFISAGEDSKVFSSKNVMSDKTSTGLWVSEGDILAPEELIKSIISHDADGPVIADNGGFTKTIALLSDTLYGGISIRFNRKDLTNIDVDQRGIARPDSTCMGAYEIGLNNVTIPLSDTTVIAGTYKDVLHGGKSVNLSVGLVAWCDTVKHVQEDGMDTIFTRMITVLPKYTKKEDGSLHYYVKENGKGDGSSWVNAMGNEAFAFAFNRVEDGATFHIAQGNYKPVYDKDGNELVEDYMQIYGSFYTTKLVNLQGGYPADVNTDVAPQPEKYRAEFSGVTSLGNVFNLVYYSLSKKGLVKVSGLSFNGSGINTNPGEIFRDALLGFDGHADQIQFEVSDCDFASAWNGVRIMSCFGSVKNCLFNKAADKGFSAVGDGYDYSTLTVESCTFDKSAFWVDNYSKCTIRNNTFLEDTLACGSVYIKMVQPINTVLFQNNTVLSRCLFENIAQGNVVGNIFERMYSKSEFIQSEENLYVGLDYLTGNDTVFMDNPLYKAYSSTDISVSLVDMRSLLEYEDKAYVLRENEGHTPTVTLLSDTLSDGTTLRYNKKEYKGFDVDQRGKYRPDSTCVGAYEVELENVIVPLPDTIVLAGTYEDLPHGTESMKINIGSLVLHDTVYSDVEDGFDTIYIRKVTVLPVAKVDEKGRYHYYVKVSGTGDGSSWEKAMSDTSFAFAFANDSIKEGATFHIAAGTYKPVYDKNGDTGQVSNKLFYTQNIVNLQGGYPADVMEEVEPQPENYRAVFNGDCGNYSECNLVYYSLKKPGTVSVKGLSFNSSGINTNPGVYFRHASLGFEGLTDNVEYVVSDCDFSQSYIALRSQYCSGLISGCLFNKNSIGVDVSGNGENDIRINSSTFDRMAVGVNGMGSCVISNSTFTYDPMSICGLSVGMYGNVNSLSLENNTILGDVQIGDSVEASISGNIMESVTSGSESITTTDNIYVGKEYLNVGTTVVIYDAYSSSDIKVSPTALQQILEYKDSAFVLNDNGGRTPTVALVTDTLPGNITIRYNHKGVTDEVVDQRGNARPDSTCMGAYEFGFTSIVIPLADTTVYAGSYTDMLHGGKTMSLKIGNVAWVDTVYGGGANAYDTIFTRNITVIPMGNADADGNYHFYVKENGKGDGSSWDDAMGAEAFAFAFGKVNDNSTFHIAQGTYSPISVTDGTKVYHSDKVVNLIGGYSSSSSNVIVLRNIISYPTILTGSYNGMTKIVELNLPEEGKAVFSGIRFEMVSASEDGEDAALMISGKGATFSLDSCSFDRTKCGVYIRDCSGTISNCAFSGTRGFGLSDEEFVPEDDAIKYSNSHSECVTVINSSFVNERRCVYGNGSSVIKNSTVVNGGDEAISFQLNQQEGASVIMENNTVLSGGVQMYSGYDYRFVGNIFGSKVGPTCLASEASHNVYVAGMSDCFDDTSNIQVSSDDIISLIKGGALYELAQAGNGTSYVELVSDVLPDGTPIRFDLSETSVTTDQRGAKRHAQCCIGAYEIGCPNTTHLYDDLVVRVGESLKDADKKIDTSFSSIGRYEWSKTLVSETDPDCTEDYSYVVTVLPNPMKDADGKLHYYVKKDGKGDGSSWEKAMGGNEFSFSFDKVEDGSTFHIAEGVYNPVYDSPDLVNSDNMSAKCFHTTHLVNIIGGYAKDVTDMNALPDTSHHTVFEGAQDHLTNAIQTSIYVLSYRPITDGHFSVEGIDFRRSTRYRQTFGTVRILPEDGVKLDFVFDHCKFYNCEGGIKSSNSAAILRNCEFDGRDGSYSVQFSGNSTDSIIIESCYIGRGCVINDCNYRITNSTIFYLQEQSGNNTTSCLVENSTIVKMDVGAARNHTWIANVFYGDLTLIGNADLLTTSSYNIYPTEETLSFFNEESDLALSQSDYFYLFDHDSVGLIAADNGGYTKTIAMKSELLPNGNSVRYDRNGITNATVDQRGVRRPAITCRGAYEFGCMPDTTYIYDEVRDYVAGSIPGRYMDTVQTLGVDGCMHYTITSYLMLPPDGTECYVTVDGANSKTGADWENAISNELFAYSLLYAKNTKKYYIAEGMYIPLLDSTGKVPEDLSKRVFYTNRAVLLAGGYTNRAKEGYVQNFKENFTCLGDTVKKNLDNVFIANISKNAEKDTLKFSGIEFSSAKKRALSQGTGEGAAVVVKTQNNSFVTYAKNCTFTNSNDGLFVERGVQIITDVNFTDNLHAGLSLQKSYQGSVTVESSSFLRNGYGMEGILFSGEYNLTNCTFYNQEASLDLTGAYEDSVQLRMVYNTVWSDTIKLSKLKFVGEGNIIGAVLKGNGLKNLGDDVLTHNLCLESSNNRLYFKGSNWFIDKEEFLSILELDPTTYIPTFWDNKGDNYTSLIRMKNDVSSIDNTLFRLSKLQNPLRDQSGALRLDMTSPGSYELSIVHDTVPVGTVLDGIVFNKIGVIDTTKNGVRYEVWVFPLNTNKSYYVKVNGTGDGSSWTNAMSASDFKWFFPQAGNGSSFYVAEGVYSFSDDELSDDGLSVLSTDKFINIIGGYPSDITDVTESADPVTYLESTVFSGAKGYIFNFVTSGAGNMRISGISFEDAPGFVRVSSVLNHPSLDFVNCQFINSSGAALSVDSCNVSIQGCFFENDSVGFVYAGAMGDSLCIYSSTFSDDSLGVVVKGNPHIFKVVNSTFLADAGLSVDYRSYLKGSLCYMYNNTIMQNLRFSNNASHEWIGNIFGCSVKVNMASDAEKANVDSRYNMYLNSSEITTNVQTSASDLVVSDEGMRSIFGVDASGSYELSLCGASKVIPLEKDILPGGDLVRFPLEEAKVKEDQCGKKRKFRTCRGAYDLIRSISEMDIPSAFTPYTQDGKNDVFLPDYELYIYDRYGNLITHSLSGWDGTYKGEMADPGVYIYVLLNPDGDNRKGTIELFKVK